MRPPALPADLEAVSAIVAGAGSTMSEGYPTWMPLRKLVLVVTD